MRLLVIVSHAFTRRVPNADNSGVRGAPALPFPRGKSNARHRGGFARPSTEHMNYSKTAVPKSSAAVFNFRPDMVCGEVSYRTFALQFIQLGFKHLEL